MKIHKRGYVSILFVWFVLFSIPGCRSTAVRSCSSEMIYGSWLWCSVVSDSVVSTKNVCLNIEIQKESITVYRLDSILERLSFEVKSNEPLSLWIGREVKQSSNFADSLYVVRCDCIGPSCGIRLVSVDLSYSYLFVRKEPNAGP